MSPVENYYCQTDPDQTMKRYKTVGGILPSLIGKVEYWSKRFGHIQHPTGWQFLYLITFI